MGVANPRGGHGRKRCAAEHAVQAAAGAERGGRGAVHRSLGRARRTRAAAPRRRRRQGHDPVTALLLRGQLTRVQGNAFSNFNFFQHSTVTWTESCRSEEGQASWSRIVRAAAGNITPM